MSLSKGKTEHSGAKNGGGMWTTREDAKRSSRKRRRREDRGVVECERKLNAA